MFLKVPGSSGHFPPQLPHLRGRHHRLGDICKNVCFTLPERVGAKAFSVSHAGAHAKNMLRGDSRVTASSLGLSKTPGDSCLTHSCFYCFYPHLSQAAFCQGLSRKSSISAGNSLRSFCRNTGVESCLLSARECGLSTVLLPASRAPCSVHDRTQHAAWCAHI